jgi:hypothetical protein
MGILTRLEAMGEREGRETAGVGIGGAVDGEGESGGVV